MLVSDVITGEDNRGSHGSSGAKCTGLRVQMDQGSGPDPPDGAQCVGFARDSGYRWTVDPLDPQGRNVLGSDHG